MMSGEDLWVSNGVVIENYMQVPETLFCSHHNAERNFPMRIKHILPEQRLCTHTPLRRHTVQLLFQWHGNLGKKKKKRGRVMSRFFLVFIFVPSTICHFSRVL